MEREFRPEWRDHKGREREKYEKLWLLQKNEDVAKAFEKFQPQLQFLFNYYVNNAFLPVDSRAKLELLQYTPFVQFAKEFNIIPGVLPLSQIAVIFKMITKHKPLMENLPVGLTYEEFCQALLRIAIKRQRMFDQIYNIAVATQGERAENLENSVVIPDNIETEDELKKLLEEDQITDNYEHIDEVTGKTVEGLLTFLDVPQDKKGQVNKVKELRVAKIVPNKLKKECNPPLLSFLT